MDREGDAQSANINADDYAEVKPVRFKRSRQGIASRDPVALEMWKKGYGIKQIAARLGIQSNALRETLERWDHADMVKQNAGHKGLRLRLTGRNVPDSNAVPPAKGQ